MECCENKNILKDKEMFVQQFWVLQLCNNTWVYMDRI